jgi:hypothetical protein
MTGSQTMNDGCFQGNQSGDVEDPILKEEDKSSRIVRVLVSVYLNFILDEDFFENRNVKIFPNRPFACTCFPYPSPPSYYQHTICYSGSLPMFPRNMQLS